MPPKNFNGKTYHDLIPSLSSKSGQGMRLPKALPGLPKPVAVSKSDLQDLPDTNEMIGLDLIRKMENFPTGKGLCAVVIDSGVFKNKYLHDTIADRLSANLNADDIDDYYGHGTHMAGIIASQKTDFSGMGIAPDAKILSIKVTRANSGDASWASIHRALRMVIDIVKTPKKHKAIGAKIAVVNISFNGLDRHKGGADKSYHRIFEAIKELEFLRVAVVLSSGNYYENLRNSGLGYPACDTVAIHAGSILNYSFHGLNQGSIATFSQRIYSELPGFVSETVVRTQEHNFLHAPGAISVSLNNSSDKELPFSILSGTSVSAAIISGAILLLQQPGYDKEGSLKSVEEIREALISGSKVFSNRGLARPVGTAPAAGDQTINNIYFDSKQYCQLNIPNALKQLYGI